MPSVVEFPIKSERLSALEADLRSLRANVDGVHIVLADACESIQTLLGHADAFRAIGHQFLALDARLSRIDAEIELLKVQKG